MASRMARAVAVRKAGVALVLWRVARWRGYLLTGDPTVSHSLASGSVSLHPQVSALLSRHAPRAAPLIVTAFGDAIAPRRSQVWMADLIALCALVGISATLVRTAVSRLVAAGRLEGVKDGRRSAYGLTPAARAEFDAAEVLIYGPVPAFDWCLVPLADEGQANALEARGFSRLRGGMLIGPGPAVDDVLAFAMTPVQGHGQLPDLAAQAWPARMPTLIGYITLFMLVVCFGGWSVTTTITGAIIASGKIEVAQNRQIVQHPDGGVVEAINVVEGQAVKAGDTLIRLAGDAVKSDLRIVKAQLIEVAARHDRLVAERDNNATVTFRPKVLAAALENPATAEQVEGQRNLFQARTE